MKIYYSCFNSLGDIQIFFFNTLQYWDKKYCNELLAYDNECMYIYVGFLETWKDYSYIYSVFFKVAFIILCHKMSLHFKQNKTKTCHYW